MTFKTFNVNGNAFPVRKFNMKKLKEGTLPSIVMIAKRGSGKSIVCKNIIAEFKDLPGGAIISPSDEANPFYAKFFPNLYIHHEFTHDKMERIWTRQKLIKKKKEKYERDKNKTIDSRAFLLMDDCLADKGKWVKDDFILKVFFNGRHYDLMYILTMQFPLGISPDLRNNFDFVFLLADDFFTNQKRLFEHYAGMFPNFSSFKDVFTDLTQDHGCMVICNKGARSNILDKIFWYKADINVEIGTFGHKQFNYINDKNFDINYDEKDLGLNDLDNLMKKKNHKTVKVDKLD